MNYKIILPIIVFTLLSGNAIAKINLAIGTSISIVKTNDKNFKNISFQDQLQPTSLNLGVNYKLPESQFILSFYTNRLLNKPLTRVVKNIRNGSLYQTQTKLTSDSLLAGYQLNRVIPAFVITKVKVKSHIISKNAILATNTNRAFVFGLNLTYFINNKFSISTTFLLPNQKLDLESGLIFGGYYNF